MSAFESKADTLKDGVTSAYDPERTSPNLP
jgi:hypothetical protein